MAVVMTPTPALPDPGPRSDIDFRAGGRGHECLIAGWSYPETEYTWTLGKRSILRLPAGEHARGAFLKLKAGPMVRQGQLTYQRLFVEVGGAMVARLVLRHAGNYEMFVPAESLPAGQPVDIVLHIPDARPPSELGGSGDSRDLGVWVTSLILESLPPEPSGAAASPVDADKAMLMAVQSLGENCELGFVQRFNGAEPFGLFRWAFTPLPNLLQALQARFRGLGEPGSLEIEVDDASEFQVLDRTYGFRNHSFAFQNAGARREEILQREQVRLPFLARMMIEDLENATKLFCFHDAGRSGADRVGRLLAALEAYGPNTLLWVCPAPAPELVGNAERLGPHLIRGYVDHFQPIHNVRKPSVEAWMGALRAAHGLWQRERNI